MWPYVAHVDAFVPLFQTQKGNENTVVPKSEGSKFQNMKST